MRWVSVIFIYLFFVNIGYCQGSTDDILNSNLKNWSLNGYLVEMPSLIFQKWDDVRISDNLVHNRLNFRWNNRKNNVNAVIELRNRLIFGKSVEIIPGYSQMIGTDNGLLNLSSNLLSGNNYILNSKIDRAYIDYTKNKFQIRLGRQRINWGQCFTWNPNDLFNAYSFFDFDYQERPGSDALRLQYYVSTTSAIEFAIAADKDGNITSASLYRFNKWNYDIQFLGGIYKSRDLVIGAGWSGNIAGASFRSEMTYFHPKNNFTDSTGTFSLSVGSEYSFKNSFMLQGEILYISGRKSGITSFYDYQNAGLNARELSFTDLSLMIQGSYPVTPLLDFSLALMFFPKIEGIYLAPSINYSVSDNISLSLICQSFTGRFTASQTERYNLGCIRLKCNF